MRQTAISMEQVNQQFKVRGGTSECARIDFVYIMEQKISIGLKKKKRIIFRGYSFNIGCWNHERVCWGFYSVQLLQHTPVIPSHTNKIENVFMLDHKRNEMLIESDKAGFTDQLCLKVCSPCRESCKLMAYCFTETFCSRLYMWYLGYLVIFKMGILPVWLKLWGCKKVLVESWAELMCLDWNRLRISTVTALIDSLRLFDEHQSTYTCILFRMVKVRI